MENVENDNVVASTTDSNDKLSNPQNQNGDSPLNPTDLPITTDSMNLDDTNITNLPTEQRDTKDEEIVEVLDSPAENISEKPSDEVDEITKINIDKVAEENSAPKSDINKTDREENAQTIDPDANIDDENEIQKKVLNELKQIREMEKIEPTDDTKHDAADLELSTEISSNDDDGENTDIQSSKEENTTKNLESENDVIFVTDKTSEKCAEDQVNGEKDDFSELKPDQSLVIDIDDNEDEKSVDEKKSDEMVEQKSNKVEELNINKSLDTNANDNSNLNEKKTADKEDVPIDVDSDETESKNKEVQKNEAVNDDLKNTNQSKTKENDSYLNEEREKVDENQKDLKERKTHTENIEKSPGFNEKEAAKQQVENLDSSKKPLSDEKINDDLLDKSSIGSSVEPTKTTKQTTEFNDPKPSTSADALALALKNSGIDVDNDTVTTGNDDDDVLVISDSDDENAKAPSSPAQSTSNLREIFFVPKPDDQNTDPFADPLANDNDEVMDTDSAFVTPTEKIIVSVPEAIPIDAEKMSKSNDTDDDLVIVSETIRDAKKTEDTISKVIDEVIEKSIIEDKDDSATLTKIQDEVPTSQVAGKKDEETEKGKEKPSIVEESLELAKTDKAAEISNEDNASKTKDIDEDVIMLDADSTDEETNESKNKTPSTPVAATTPTDTKIDSPEKSADPIKNLEDLVTIAAAESVKRTLASESIKETKKKDDDSNETNNVDTSVDHPEPVKRKVPKDCVNFECKSKRTDNHVPAPIFVLSHFNVTKKLNRIQYVCEPCFDIANEKYSIFKEALINEQPLLLETLPKRAEFYEILDSSDEDSDDICIVDKLAIAERDKPLPKELINTLLDNLDDVIGKAKVQCDLEKQAIWSDQINTHKLVSNDDLINEINNMCKDLQKRADSMHNRLYRNGNYVIEDLPPLDLNTLKQMQLAGPTYPPPGEFKYTKLDTFSLYYAVRSKLLAAWVPCKIIEEIPFVVGTLSQKTTYKVKFLRSKGIQMKSVLANNIAYGKPPPVRLQVGTRVIALFQIDPPSGPAPSQQTTGPNQRASYFPGVIAEPLQSYNSWRYLIFFDDGYAQYVPHDNIRVICESSSKVWEDVHPDSATFIENYLLQYKTQRPMVQVRKGQRMITEWNGKWLYAKVTEIDASLVQMSFEEGRRIEWIYRGSTRLGPLFNEKQSQKTSVGLAKRNVPYVEYMSTASDVSGKNQSRQPNIAAQTSQPSTSASAGLASALNVKPAEQLRRFQQMQLQQQQQQQQQQLQQHQSQKEQQHNHQKTPAEEKRAVAKKSTSAQPPPPAPPSSSNSTTNSRPTVQHMNNSTIYVEEDNRPKGKVVYYTAKKHMPPRKFQLHECNPACLYDVKHNLSSYSPLAKPLLSGWERQICRSKSRKIVVYRSPCGRRLRNMGELHQYIRKTKCPLNVENFDFDFLIHCLAEYVIDACIYQEKDISDGKEAMAVPCVNYYDNTKPPACIYSARRIPTDGVNLELDTNFLCGCDCEDDCLDKTKCQCWQLTIAGAKFGNPNSVPENVGYEFKRLPDPVPTGIYECNSRCKCAKTCMNRVAQHSIQLKLQVFKTGNRGWGLRCLNDVPKGSFICIYAGDLLTEQNANEAGDNYGDEYFAELDYIEVAENLKEGYEPDVLNDDDLDDDEYQPDLDANHKGKDDDSEDDEFVAKTSVIVPARKTRYNTRNSSIDSKADDKLKVSKKNDKKKDGNDKIDPVTGEVIISDEDEERQQISFIPNASATSLEKDNATSKYKSIRKLYGKNEYVYIMDAKKRGNIGRYFNHSCSPNLFVQNVFVDTHDLRFPWVAFFALSHIRAGTELTWNYNYDVGSVPGKVLYCQCGSEACRGRLL